MTLSIAINGFGRIGRMVLRSFLKHPPLDISLLAINDLTNIETSAHLLTYDSVHGPLDRNLHVDNSSLLIDGSSIAYFSCASADQFPWKKLGIDVVLECSGRFTSQKDAQKHIAAGAKKVIISAPANESDLTVVYGVNHDLITNTHAILSNGSCTTNCLAPVAMILDKTVGIESGYMTTIHSYTADQRLVDTAHTDLRRARSASLSMIPTSTGAAKALGLVLPNLKGKLDGTSIRVPTANVSVIDFTFLATRNTSVTEINDAFIQASKTTLKGVLAVSAAPLVSCDFNGNPHSAIVDLEQTQVVNDRFCRVLAWYDNECGFSNRMIDVLKVIQLKI